MATRSVALVEDAGVAITEAVRQLAKSPTGALLLRAWFDDAVPRLRVEVVDRGGPAVETSLPTVAALATDWGTGTTDDGATVWFEMEPRGLHRPHGRSA